MVIPFFGILILPGCNPMLYSNVGQNVPMFKSRGEGSVSCAGMRVTNKAHPNYQADSGGLAFQLALAPTDHVALMASLYAHGKGTNDKIAVSGEGNGYFELGSGFFGLAKDSPLVYEAFAGNGFGWVRNTYSGGVANANILKPFVQPSIGFSGKTIDFAITLRIAYLHYYHIDNTFSAGTDVSNFLAEKQNNVLIEPGFTFRIGFRELKLQYQYCVSTLNFDPVQYNLVNPVYNSLGLFLRIPTRLK